MEEFTAEQEEAIRTLTRTLGLQPRVRPKAQ